MGNINFYGYAAGSNSNVICRDIVQEVNYLKWYLRDCEQKNFADKIRNADLIFIVADLNNSSEKSNVEQMVNTAEKFGIPTLVYFLFPIKLTSQAGKEGICIKQLDLISKASVLIGFDDSSVDNDINNCSLLFNYYTNKGFNDLSTKLILAIRGISEPMVRQELVGVDFADYRLAFENKGLYQTKTFTQEALLKAKENNEPWLAASVIIVTIFLKVDGAIDVFSKISTTISNMLEGGELFWLCTAVIDEQIKDEPMIIITYNQ